MGEPFDARLLNCAIGCQHLNLGQGRANSAQGLFVVRQIVGFTGDDVSALATLQVVKLQHGAVQRVQRFVRFGHPARSLVVPLQAAVHLSTREQQNKKGDDKAAHDPVTNAELFHLEQPLNKA